MIKEESMFKLTIEIFTDEEIFTALNTCETEDWIKENLPYAYRFGRVLVNDINSIKMKVDYISS